MEFKETSEELGLVLQFQCRTTRRACRFSARGYLPLPSQGHYQWEDHSDLNCPQRRMVNYVMLLVDSCWGNLIL